MFQNPERTFMTKSSKSLSKSSMLHFGMCTPLDFLNHKNTETVCDFTRKSAWTQTRNSHKEENKQKQFLNPCLLFFFFSNTFHFSFCFRFTSLDYVPLSPPHQPPCLPHYVDGQGQISLPMVENIRENSLDFCSSWRGFWYMVRHASSTLSQSR